MGITGPGRAPGDAAGQPGAHVASAEHVLAPSAKVLALGSAPEPPALAPGLVPVRSPERQSRLSAVHVPRMDGSCFGPACKGPSRFRLATTGRGADELCPTWWGRPARTSYSSPPCRPSQGASLRRGHPGHGLPPGRRPRGSWQPPLGLAVGRHPCTRAALSSSTPPPRRPRMHTSSVDAPAGVEQRARPRGGGP